MGNMLKEAAQIIRSTDHQLIWLDDYWANHHDRIAADLDLVDRYPGRVLDVGAMPYFASLALRLQSRPAFRTSRRVFG